MADYTILLFEKLAKTFTDRYRALLAAHDYAGMQSMAPITMGDFTIRQAKDDYTQAILQGGTFNVPYYIADSSGRTVRTGEGQVPFPSDMGGGLSTDYGDLTNKPEINSVTLSGDKSSSDLGLADASHSHTTSDITDFPTIPVKNTWYATCSSSSGSGSKTATTVGGDFTLATGNMVRVKMSNSNSALNPTISIDGSTAKTIQAISGNSGVDYYWRGGETIDLVYDGTNWLMSDGGKADTSWYGITKLNSSTSSTSTSEAATPSAVKSAYDLANGKTKVQIVRW